MYLRGILPLARTLFITVALLTLLLYLIVFADNIEQPLVARTLILIAIGCVVIAVICHVIFEARYSGEKQWQSEMQARAPVPDHVFNEEAAVKYGLLAHEAAVPAVVRRIVFQAANVPVENVWIDDKFPVSILRDLDCSDIVDDLESTFSISLPPPELDELTLDDLIRWVLNTMRHND